MVPLLEALSSLSTSLKISLSLAAIALTAITANVLKQLYLPNPHRPPVVFHIFPFIGSTVEYGVDPYKFFFRCRAQYGDCFTFIMLGKPTTVYLGPKGNNFILNGKHADMNAEEIYGKLMTPVFGPGVIYDCPNERLMEHKRIVRDGFSTDSLRKYVPGMVKEVEDYIRGPYEFTGKSGICNVTEAIAQIALYVAARSLQGAEVRKRFDGTFATLYRHLDDGFQPINFIMPWLPLPQNRRRDHARVVMEELYSDIISRRRQRGNIDGETDMLWSLMEGEYKDGSKVSDIHIARLMIALLMAGQHNTAATGAWIILHLANRPDIIEDLYQEQKDALGWPLPPLTWDNLQKLKLNERVIKETLRLHSPIHSILRQVTRPLAVPETDWVIPPSHTMLAPPSLIARTEDVFERPMVWDPSRWEDAQKDNQEGEEKESAQGVAAISKAVTSPYLPFGGGRHRCPGETYAYTQLGAIIATMVRMMEWEQVDPKAPVPEPDYSSMFVRPAMPATIKWRLRE
ncbi:cytochrome p450 domain-containing protein [Sarocladium implicatum]|nr:cytochrome p450 domain-containing protein [Sarocladium implicatum]